MSKRIKKKRGGGGGGERKVTEVQSIILTTREKLYIENSKLNHKRTNRRTDP